MNNTPTCKCDCGKEAPMDLFAADTQNPENASYVMPKGWTWDVLNDKYICPECSTKQ